MRLDEQIERFRKRIDIRGKNECWPWTGGKSSKEVGQNYGKVWFMGRKHRAHRLAYELFNRSLLPTELVCHSCDNPPCCNPKHLFVGNHYDNTHDCISKGRSKKERGVDRYNSKLSENMVREIRHRYVPRIFGVDKLAQLYPVSRSMIFAIVKRKRWKHIK